MHRNRSKRINHLFLLRHAEDELNSVSESLGVSEIQEQSKCTKAEDEPCKLYGSQYCQECCSINVSSKECQAAIRKNRFNKQDIENRYK